MHDAPDPILKFKVIEDHPDDKNEKYVDMKVKKFQFKAGGEGVCPKCGGKTVATHHDWVCEDCGLKLNGPIF